jgi:hypothetical protein
MVLARLLEVWTLGRRVLAVALITTQGAGTGTGTGTDTGTRILGLSPK